MHIRVMVCIACPVAPMMYPKHKKDTLHNKKEASTRIPCQKNFSTILLNSNVVPGHWSKSGRARAFIKLQRAFPKKNSIKIHSYVLHIMSLSSN